MLRVLALLAAVILSTNLWAYDPVNKDVTGHELPAELENVGVTEKLGQNLDLALTFTNEKGESIPLGSLFHKERPVLMAMVYYTCPSLCNLHLNGLTETLKQLKWTSGREFEVVAVSMNHEETPDVAEKKKQNYLKAYGRPDGDSGWHFLVGNKENVSKLAEQLGFKFKWLEDKQQFAHAAVAYVVTPGGKISRYLHGIQPEVATLKLSLLEASNGTIGSVLEQVMMFCLQFDPRKNKYTLYAWNLMRIGAILMVLVLALVLIPLWLREQANNGKRT